MAGEVKTPPVQGSSTTKPTTFGQITDAPPVESKKDAALKDAELDEDLEDRGEEDSLDEAVDEGGENEEAEEVEEGEEGEEGKESEDEEVEEDEEDEGEEPEEDSLIDEETGEVDRSKLAEAISKLPPKEIDKALGSVKVDVKVDGKMEKVTLAQLKESYSSTAHNSRWAQKNRDDEKKIVARMQEVEETIGPTWDALKNDKFEDAFLSLAGIRGKNILEVKRQLRAELAPVILGLAKMTEDQRKTWLIQEENEFYRSQQESTKKKDTETRTKSEAQQTVLQVQRQHGISDAEMEAAVDWLLEKKLGGDKTKLTIDMVVETVTVSRSIDRALEAITISKPSLRSDAEFVDRVVRLAKANPNAPMSKLAKWVREHAPSGKDKDASELAKDISRKVLKTRPKASLEKPSKQKPKSFSDLP